VREITDQIKGQKNAPAANVFKNIRIQWFRKTPAAPFLDIMDGGYAKAPGMRCTHCRDERDFSSDAKSVAHSWHSRQFRCDSDHWI
jgi:hypothetical protein